MQRRSPILLPLAYGMMAGAAHAAAPAYLPGPTCEAIDAERATIETAVAQGGAKAAKRRQGVARFVRGAASYAAPSLMGQFGGGSQAAAIAAQAVGQGALQALETPQATPQDLPAAKPSRKQRERLDQLIRLAADRGCAG